MMKDPEGYCKKCKVYTLNMQIDGCCPECTFDFSMKVKEAAEQSVLKIIQEGSWVKPDYHNAFKLPQEFVAEIWGLVDQDKIKREMAAIIEKEAAKRIMAAIAGEISNDIKRFLSNPAKKAAVKKVAEEKLKEIMNA